MERSFWFSAYKNKEHVIFGIIKHLIIKFAISNIVSIGILGNYKCLINDKILPASFEVLPQISKTFLFSFFPSFLLSPKFHQILEIFTFEAGFHCYSINSIVYFNWWVFEYFYQLRRQPWRIKPRDLIYEFIT